MGSNRQMGLRLDETDSLNLMRIAQREGRNEQRGMKCQEG